jgi:predicted RND superfamily exporter protein
VATLLTDNTKVTLTIHKFIAVIIALAVVGFTTGMTRYDITKNAEALERQEIQLNKNKEEIVDVKITLSRITAILEKMAECNR